MVIDERTIEAMVLGGAVLGGGGGGSLALGRELGRQALDAGVPRLTSLGQLAPDALVVTVSMVGAPAAPERFVTPDDFVAAVELLQEHLTRPIAGLITSENGGTASVNGLIQAAALGIPFIDAPCNGRAHPTGVMGSMALGAEPGFLSVQAAVGGDPDRQRRVRTWVEAPLGMADRLIRNASVEAGGMVAVARNPVSGTYLRENGAPGAISMALRLGEILMDGQRAGDSGAVVAENLAAELGGRVLAAGPVEEVELETKGGYDVGRLRIDDLEITFWNEYMTVDRAGTRIATFPDLLTTLDLEDGTPLATAELQTGREVVLLWAPRTRLILGAGMREQENFRVVEEVLGVPILDHLFGRTKASP